MVGRSVGWLVMMKGESEMRVVVVEERVFVEEVRAKKEGEGGEEVRG